MADAHLWTARAPQAGDAELLDDAERERATTFHDPADRDAYVAAHALLRRALSTLDPGQAPSEWRIEAAPGGRPTVAHSDLRCSLSHTRGLAAVLVADGVDVGVDAEGPARLDVAALDVFAPAERAALDALADPSARDHHARALWTLKEAHLKAQGRGLGAADPRESAFALGDPVQGPPGFAFTLDTLGEHLLATAIRLKPGRGRPTTVMWATRAPAAP